MKKLVRRLFLICIIAIVLLVGIFFISYKSGISKVSNDSKAIEFNVESGNNFYSIASDLKKAGLIKSTLFYKLYIKLNSVSKIQTGVYELNKAMSVEEIVKTLQGKSKNLNEVSITFKEGYDMPDIIEAITSKTNIKEEDIINKLKDAEYLNSLISKYWFIDESILEPSLYYSLEGYLYPETYRFKDKNISIDEIFDKMINQMDKKLENYKQTIEANNYSFHQLLTLASIVELEGLNPEDRKGVAGVFYNRLNANMNLGSDVTTYYGARVQMGDRDLYMDEINSDNPYNTRSNTMMGKLPIGPICNPSITSIEAVIHPDINNYYYFVSDKNGKTYFASTLNEHNSVIAQLKQEGLWYEY